MRRFPRDPPSNPAPLRSIGTRGLVLVAFGTVVLAAAAPLLGGLASNDSATVEFNNALRSIAAAIFFGAGITHYARWRLTGDAASGLASVALLVFGSLTFPLAMTAGMLHDVGHAVTLSPVTRLITTVATLTALTMVLRAPPVDRRLRPLRLAGLLIGASLGTFLALVLLHNSRAVNVDPSLGTHLALEIGMAGAWLAYGAAFLVRGVRRRRATSLWIGTSIGLVGVGSGLRAVAVVFGQPWLLVATTVQLGAAVAALVGAGLDLQEAYARHMHELASAQDVLAETEHVLRGAERRRQERRREQRHDVRSLIAALRIATTTLDRYDDGRLDAETKHRLRASVMRELCRLEQLIDPPGRSAAGDGIEHGNEAAEAVDLRVDPVPADDEEPRVVALDHDADVQLLPDVEPA